MAKLSKSGLVYLLTYTSDGEVEVEGIFTSLHKAMVGAPGEWVKVSGEAMWRHCTQGYQIDATPINERLGGS